MTRLISRNIFCAVFLPFLLFIGILGGLQVYGFLGIVAGPLVVTLLTSFVEIYREEFAETTEAPGTTDAHS